MTASMIFSFDRWPSPGFDRPAQYVYCRSIEWQSSIQWNGNDHENNFNIYCHWCSFGFTRHGGSGFKSILGLGLMARVAPQVQVYFWVCWPKVVVAMIAMVSDLCRYSSESDNFYSSP
ncbi:hypothetical protein [Candidatus Villigracilis saccharophilus]|uniref:hypothetical protein n=1 Tax=Candidatus Villigracilis saccharophilus TaxID=3140684 RepID=UPI0031F03AE1